MVKVYPEFYNDCFGPIMQPGSSSHMAAPCRAGYMCNSLLCGDDVAEILVELDNDGSFKGTFGQMNEDLGMLNGAMGHLPDYDKFFDIKPFLRNNGIPFKFDFCSMKESSHINALKFTITGKSGKKATLVANSTGGGMIETVWVNGYGFRGVGDTYVLFVRDDEKKLSLEGLKAELEGVQPYLDCGEAEGQKDGRAFWFMLDGSPLPALCEVMGKYDHFKMDPVLPVTTSAAKKEQLFDTMTEWRRLAEEQGKTLPEVAIDYEIAASGWSRDEVVAYMRDVIKPTMYRRTHAVYEEDVQPVENEFTDNRYKSWQANMDKLPMDIGVIAKTIKYVLGGNPTIPGVLNVPGPMGSGGGFVYGVLSAVQEEYGLSEEAVLDALFVAAGVGAICYTRTGPTGEVIGCTGECGCCAAMASAGLAQLMGGTPMQVENAASFALQAAVGWPCDPIPGGRGMPCGSRVMYVAAMSVVYAEYALTGQDAVLPFHEVVDVADKIGRNLDGDLLCTARGGHCAAPTAMCMSAKFRDWHSKQ